MSTHRGDSAPQKESPLGEPICHACGYSLSGLTDSSKCPECGRPLVEVLTRSTAAEARTGKRYRSVSTLMGLPAIDIAFGPAAGERLGRARGFLALGDQATGIIAIGGSARGIVAIGGAANGVFAIGGMSLGLVSAVGGAAMGGCATGGAALGGVAKGGGAIGIIAEGGGAIGYYARGGGVVGRYVVDLAGNGAPEATMMFDRMAWLMGGWSTGALGSVLSLMQMAVVLGGLTVLLGAALAAIAVRADQRGGRDSTIASP